MSLQNFIWTEIQYKIEVKMSSFSQLGLLPMEFVTEHIAKVSIIQHFAPTAAYRGSLLHTPDNK